MLKKVWDWLRTDPKDERWQRTLDRYSAQLAKEAPARHRRRIFTDPMVSRETLLKYRIWVDGQGNRILFEHMDIQRLVNILIYKSARAYKGRLREYFSRMIGVASSPTYYEKGVRQAGQMAIADSHADPAIQAITQELVRRGEALMETTPSPDACELHDDWGNRDDDGHWDAYDPPH